MKHPAVMAIAGLLALAATPGIAATVTVGFEGATADVETAAYRESGVTFRVVSGHYDIFGNTARQAFNVDNVFTGPVEIEITFDGGLFDLIGFDVTDVPATDEAVFTSDLGDSFTVAGVPGRNLFPTAFNGVSTITLSYDSFDPFAFDDFTIDDRGATDPDGGGGETPPPVPLPASLPLLAAALGGLGVAARRRRVSRT